MQLALEPQAPLSRLYELVLKIVVDAEKRGVEFCELRVEGAVFPVDFIREFNHGIVEIACIKIRVGFNVDVSDLLSDILVQDLGILSNRLLRRVQG